MNRSIRFFKKDGEVQYRQNLLNSLDNALATITNGSYILTVGREAKKRTTDQNALMWLWFTCIERETGTDRNDVHDYYCTRFLRRTTDINGKQATVVSGTSKLTTGQFTDFLNKVQADAAGELGIKLPTPDDLYFESFKQEYALNY